MSLLERFTAKYSIDAASGCWTWVAGTNGAGYGLIRPGGKAPRELAHRISWILFKGPIHSDGSYHGICVLHRCDNTLCVNPEHLFLGTNADNIRDSQNKQRRGRKLTAEKVQNIMRRLSEGEAVRKLARENGVNRTTVKKIKARRYWKHMEAQNFQA